MSVLANSIFKEANIVEAREEIAKKFKEDRNFFKSYIDNVGFLIEQNKEDDCYKIAEKVLKLIFEMDEEECPQ